MVMVMAGSMSEDYVTVGGSSPANGFSNLQHCQSVESLAEWRSCDQVENGTPSTSPPYWDSDEEDDHGSKPSDLYGKFTWKIENFSQISKRELRSNMFEVGGYKWYILIYPQGCDACNHLSLFLCVADHDKLLPGWGHYALFTIAVVNRDPKKNKYNDTLHKFCKKEHDWGWKKFLEQTKVMDGFVDDDTLTIKAQVQVIREKAHRPFRCLDCQYRRELIRVYLSNVEQTCGRFVDEKRQKLQTLVGDKAMWSSFHVFWLGIDQDARCHLSRDKIDDILKKVVKHFFIEKEVSSTLVMDSLYSGLRALENMIKMKKLQLKNHEESAPFILIEDGMFVLADDVFLLLERAALELPRLSWPSKEENGLPNRAKDGSSGDEFNRGSVLCEERRLTELGCKTLEIFILADIFSNRIERAYREAVALKIQEELIREEEAAEQAENEKREKRAKKKQAKQRRNNRKSKDGVNDEKSEEMMAENIQLKECAPDEQVLRGDASDPGNDGNEARQPDVEYKDASQIHRSTEACSSVIPDGHSEKRSSCFVDDGCSTELVLSAAKGPYNWNILPNSKNKRNSSRRGKKQQNQEMRNGCPSNAARLLNVSSSSISTGPEPKGLIYAFKDQIKKLEQTFFKKSSKEELYVTTSGEAFLKDQIDKEIPCISMPTESSSSSTSPTGKLLIKTNKEEVSTPELTSRVAIKTEKIEEVSTPDLTSQVLIKTEKIEEVSRPELAPKILIKTEKIEEVSTPRLTLTTLIKTKKSANPSVKSPQNLSISKSEAPKHQASSTSRPCVPITTPTVSLGSSSQASPLLSGTLSSINSLKSKPSLLSQNLEQQSYRNVIMGVKTMANARTTRPNLQPSSSSLTQSYPFFQPSSSSSVNPGISFGSVRPESLHNIRIGSNYESVASSSHSQGAMPDEFPHLDIINDLLEEDGIVGMATFNGYHIDDIYPLNWQRNFATDVDPLHGPCQLDLPEYYYDEMSQVVYESFVPFSGFSELQHAQSDFSVYGNGADAFIQNQWPIDRVDLSMMNFGRTMDVNGYAYQVLEHATCGVGAYNVMHHPGDGI